MCKCIREWVTDPDAKGDHNKVAVTCEQHIAALEAEISRLSELSIRVMRASTSIMSNAVDEVDPQHILPADSTADSAAVTVTEELNPSEATCDKCGKVVPLRNGYYAPHAPGDDPYVECFRTGDVPRDVDPSPLTLEEYREMRDSHSPLTHASMRLDGTVDLFKVKTCPHGSTNLKHCCNEYNDSCTPDCVEVPYTLGAQPLTTPDQTTHRENSK